ncbi:MAG: ROK family protein [Candidatus Sulfotelmatobacter sp.]
MMKVPDPCFIGVDVGGTKVACGLVDSIGEITHQTRIPMVATDAAAGLAAVTSAIDSVLPAAEHKPELKDLISGIGICAPGPLDPRTGVVINPPNLPGWRNFPLAELVSKAYRLPVRIDNDGNAAALAEAIWGAGRGYRNVFCATIGTGIGTGIVFDGHIYHGRTGAAAEGGHNTIDYRGPRCGCGKLGCIEALASGPAIARRASEKINAGRRSSIMELAGGRIDQITSEMVGEAYCAGDSLAREVLEETAMFLTVWLGNIVDLLEPDVMIIGGGAASMLQPFFGEIRDRLSHWSVNSRCREIPLVTAHYGSDAGIAGGAALCRELLPHDLESKVVDAEGI